MFDRKKFLTRFCLICSMIFISALLRSQSIYITNIQQQEDEVIITYNLIYKDISGVFNVEASYAADGSENYTSIKKAKGFIGNGVNPGISKKIVWKFTEEAQFARQVQLKFKINARLIAPFSAP
jgi:hypothetical protein